MGDTKLNRYLESAPKITDRKDRLTGKSYTSSHAAYYYSLFNSLLVLTSEKNNITYS